MKYFITLFFLILSFYFISYAKHAYVSNIPNGEVNNCIACHPQGNYSLNPFGKETKNFKSGNAIIWNIQLAALDSDGDGFSNGVELQDPEGKWTMDNPQPGESYLVTNPGDDTSFPETSPVNEIITIGGFELNSVSPNPVTSNTMLSYSLTNAGLLKISLFDLSGKLIKIYVNQNFEKGVFNLSLNSNFNQSGIYFLVAEFEGNKKVVKLLFVN